MWILSKSIFILTFAQVQTAVRFLSPNELHQTCLLFSEKQVIYAFELQTQNRKHLNDKNKSSFCSVVFSDFATLSKRRKCHFRRLNFQFPGTSSRLAFSLLDRPPNQQTNVLYQSRICCITWREISKTRKLKEIIQSIAVNTLETVKVQEVFCDSNCL